MPSSVVSSFAKKTGKSIPEVEHFWKEAKAKAKQEYPNAEENKYYVIVTGILKKMLNIKESDNTIADLFRQQLLEDGEPGIPVSSGTVTGDIAKTDLPLTSKKKLPVEKRNPDGQFPDGSAVFDIDEDFSGVGKILEGKERYKWMKNHVKDQGIAKWAAENPGASFHLRNKNTGVHFKVR